MTYSLPLPLACAILFATFVLLFLPQAGGYWSRGEHYYEPRYWHAMCLGAIVWGKILLIAIAAVLVAWSLLSVLVWLEVV